MSVPVLLAHGYAIQLAAYERFSATSFDIADTGLCEVELAVVGPDALQYFRLPSGEHVPIVRDLYGSMEPGGSQLAFVAPVAGEYRIRVRNIDPLQAPCTGYQMAVVRGVSDNGPSPIH